MKRWVYYYLIPLIVLLALILLPYSKGEEIGPGSSSPAPAAVYQGQAVRPTIIPGTPYPPPASNPRGRITEINFRDPITGVYSPMLDGGELPVDAYHFNVKIRNDSSENVLAYVDIVQHGGPMMLPLGAPEWLLTPGLEVYLFVQGANLKPAKRSFQFTVMLKERGSNRVLDQRTMTVTSTLMPAPRPAVNPVGRITEINYRDPLTGVYKPVQDGGELPVDVYHFNVKMRNEGEESVLALIDMVQHEGPGILPLGTAEWFLLPGQEVYLFKQGTNLRPAGRTYQLSFILKERVTDKVLDQKTLRVTSR